MESHFSFIQKFTILLECLSFSIEKKTFIFFILMEKPQFLIKYFYLFTNFGLILFKKLDKPLSDWKWCFCKIKKRLLSHEWTTTTIIS